MCSIPSEGLVCGSKTVRSVSCFEPITLNQSNSFSRNKNSFSQWIYLQHISQQSTSRKPTSTEELHDIIADEECMHDFISLTKIIVFYMMVILYNSGAKFTNEANVHVRIVCDMLQTLLK